MGAVTPVSREDLVEQLVELVDERLLRPLDALLETASIDSLRRLVGLTAKTWAGRLTDPDDEVAAATAAHLIGTLYGAGPFEPPRDWWRTPLGRVVLRSIGHPGAERVSYATAGAMLDITRQGVHDLAARGKLDRHPDGGVTTVSVRRRVLAHSG
jgi:hypothetical protein